MLHSGIKIGLITVVVALLGYNSIYIRKLSEHKADAHKAFDAKAYAREHIFKQVPSFAAKAENIEELITKLQKNPKETMSAVPEARRSGTELYFLVKGEGQITEVAGEYVLVKTKAGSVNLRIVTEYIFGNTSRNASGTIKPNNFETTMDFNSVSEEINRLIRTEVLPPFKQKVKMGDSLAFIAALEISETDLDLKTVELIPLKLVVGSN